MTFFNAPKFRVELDVKLLSNLDKKLRTKIVLKEDRKIILGRSLDEADIVLNDPGASRQHIRLLITDGKVWIEDLKTKNGTYINGEKIDSKSLAVGDVITLGSHQISVSNIKQIEDTSDITSLISCEKLEATSQFQIVRNISAA